MSEEKTTKTMTATIAKIFYAQQCLCCENTRRLPEGMTYCHTSWVCDECKEAIAFVKELKHKQENFDPLKPVLD
jgi:hypothetical protein